MSNDTISNDTVGSDTVSSDTVDATSGDSDPSGAGVDTSAAPERPSGQLPRVVVDQPELERPDAQPSSRRWRRIAAPLLGLVIPLVLLGLWHRAATSGSFSQSQLPTPASVVAAARELIDRGTLWEHIAITVQRVLTGFVIGATAGSVIGSLVGLSRTASLLLSPILRALRAVPSLAWVPLLLIWMGIHEEPKITLVAIGAFFPVFTTVASGFAHVDQKLVEVGRAYGLRGPRLATGVLLPAAAPTIVAGLRLGLAQAWLFVVAAELIASSKGLGFLLIDSQSTLRTDILFLSIVLLALLGTLSDQVLAFAERRLLRWT
ncbi:MAG: ABC transporter permease [Nocardiopsis sp. BM-2018]|nr:MAG: ABC transporter permease [Nocardiopsis sp. BM-2018]